MSKINYRRKVWKVKFRKPVSVRPSKPMDDNKYVRHKVKLHMREILKEVSSETHTE